MTVMETEPALAMLIREVSEMVSTMSSSPMTWNVDTGSKVNVPGPVVEKSNTVETAERGVQHRPKSGL